MNRNSTNHFYMNPTNVDLPRSRFPRAHKHLTTMDTGRLYPIYVDEILPGDTVQMDLRYLTRMMTPIFPVMDNAYMDVYFFFVPSRLVWEHWINMHGENDTDYWSQPVEYTVPQLSVAPDSDVDNPGVASGTVADYMGIPTKVYGDGAPSVSALPFRAYVKIWNDWFRDENCMPPAQLWIDDTSRTFSTSIAVEDSYLTAGQGGALLPVSKFHDYFTSVLPSPQKGPAVTLPLGTDTSVGFSSVDYLRGQFSKNIYNLTLPSGSTINGGLGSYVVNSSGDPVSPFLANRGENLGTISSTGENLFLNGNLALDLSGATGVTINALRQAFAVQVLLEKDARGGTRYIEMLKSHFGVTSPDARLQRSEYLGGKRIPINMSQVVQTSSTDDTSPQGNTGAYSLTAGLDKGCFTKSFVEHGYLIGVACIRTLHTYQQGLERFWSRKSRFDFYYPTLANISEQPVLNKEIYLKSGTSTDLGPADSDSNVNNEVFG